MEKKIVAKGRPYKRKVLAQKPEIKYVRGPGFVERTLMCLMAVLKGLLGLIERRIKKLRAKRLAERMSGEDKI